MRLRNTIVVLVLLVIVGGYALVLLLGSRPAPTPTLLKVAAKDISRIDLRYPAREIELVRNPDRTWRIVKPIKADADQTAIDGLTQTIAGAPLSKTVVDKPKSLGPFGLDKPAVVLTITTDNKGALPALDVGKTSPLGNGVYVKRAGAPAVLMTTSDFSGAVTKQLNDLRSHELVSFDMDQANKVTIKNGAGPLIEVDKRGGKWRIVQPARYLADSDAVSRMLTALANARVADFVTDAPKDLGQYGLATPQLEVSVFTGKDDARHALLFGLEQPSAYKHTLYVKRGSDPYVFTVEDTLIGKVNLSVWDLRDKTVMAFDPLKAGRVEITNHGKQYTLERTKAGKWQVIADGKTSPASDPAVQTFLDELANLKGDKIIADPMGDPKEYGMDQPTEQITVYDKDGKLIGTVKLDQIQSKVEIASPQPTPAAPGAPASAAKVTRSVMRFENYAHSTAGTPVYSLREAGFSQFDMTAGQFQASQPAAAPTPAKKS